MEENGRMHIFEIVDEKIKIKGLGVFNPTVALNGINFEMKLAWVKNTDKLSQDFLK